VVRKDHRTGEVQFRIEAVWREAALPGALGHLGFHLLARRYLRAWHRLAHLRLRARAAPGAGCRRSRGASALVHVGLPLPAPPIERMAGPQPPPGFGIVGR
jgi:hypothetical protein